MHNSGSWAHRSPVAVAGKVTQVIEQTNNSKRKAILKLRLKHETPSLWWGNTCSQDQRGNVSKCSNRASNYPHPLLLSLQLRRGRKFGGTIKTGILLSASESYTCTEWIASPAFCGLTPQFVHINDIPKCVWMALVPTQDLLFQRDANVVLSETPLSGPLLTARATV